MCFNVGQLFTSKLLVFFLIISSFLFHYACFHSMFVYSQLSRSTMTDSAHNYYVTVDHKNFEVYIKGSSFGAQGGKLVEVQNLGRNPTGKIEYHVNCTDPRLSGTTSASFLLQNLYLVSLKRVISFL